MKNLINKLSAEHNLTDSELKNLIDNITDEDLTYMHKKARECADGVYGKKIFIRGLIEFTNYCKNNCYYCGIRCGNKNVSRYRLNKEDILSCCREGYDLGFRTFVLQGGEDPFFTDGILCDIVKSMREEFPQCAITLSVGERSYESYKMLKNSGANRFLLRHETADCKHYSKLHPQNMSYDNRMECLKNLKALGYQVGCGFMVGSPFQNTDCLVKDLRFIKEFSPEMVGIGPFITHKDTPFKDEPNGSARLTLMLISIIRLLVPEVLLPATTALGTVSEKGRETGVLAGANVVMPNLSPLNVREKYTLYNNKISTGEEAAQGVELLKNSMAEIGYTVVTERGDNIKFN
ncbi:MAG: [FeFe] hydrogenase H-cluster radical SAM maturase HydE [Oscillospiraceae bacterium]|nr:[FeFe] hydrogenase H-cluster radical SAM maturase HydE [Oscillospiraceae bacterium]